MPEFYFSHILKKSGNIDLSTNYRDMPQNLEHDTINELYELVTSPDEFDQFIHKLGGQLDALENDNSGYAALLAEHMTRASELLEAVTPWESYNDNELSQNLIASLQAAFAVDANGCIVDANPTAKTKYDIQPGDVIDRLPLEGFDGVELHSMVSARTNPSTKENASGNVYRFRHVDTEQAVLLTVERYQSSKTKELLAIIKTTDYGWSGHLGPILKDLFKLTDAEVAVLRLLVDGSKLDEIADYRAASLKTIRTQLRSIFSKTETHSQSECIKLVFGMSLLHNRKQGDEVAKRLIAESNVTYYPNAEHRRILDLPGGKKLEYSIFGARDGQAILFYHCHIFGDTWSEEAVNALRRARLRVIAPLRPGFGLTSLYEGEYSDPHVFAKQIKTLLDHENIDQASAITMSGGLQNCLAAVQLMPGRIKGITATRPLLPAMSIADLEGLSGYNYLIPSSRINFRPALRFLCKAGFAFFQTVGMDKFLRAFWRSSPSDVEWSTSPEILPLFEHAKRIHSTHGYLGAYGDIAYPEDWSGLLDTCTVPVRFVIGENDRNLPWPAMKKYEKKCPHISINKLSGPGRIVQHEHYSHIIQWVLSDLRS